VKVPKPGDADRARFSSLLPDDPRVEVKPMFGNLGAFVHGNMFMGLFGPQIGVKLPDADQRELVEAGGGPFGPEQRPMGGYVSLPSGCTGSDAGPWIAKALAYVASLPPKKPKAVKNASKPRPG
jgi:TfoX/Sxy family transcriptional regulator of competence genes